MKKILCSLIALAALTMTATARDELFVDAVFVKLSCYTPYQIPIPWFHYEEDSTLWGEYSVYGVDLGLPWSASKNVYGIGTGLYLDYAMTAGVSFAIASDTETLFGIQTGIYNYAECANGIQLGIVNLCDRAHGLQVGVVNIIKTSPVTFLPVLNAQF